MIAYKLNNTENLNANHIINSISKLLRNTPKDILQSSVLVIRLEKITDYQGDTLLPKIEYKDQDSLT